MWPEKSLSPSLKALLDVRGCKDTESLRSASKVWSCPLAAPPPWAASASEDRAGGPREAVPLVPSPPCEGGSRPTISWGTCSSLFGLAAQN